MMKNGALWGATRCFQWLFFGGFVLVIVVVLSGGGSSDVFGYTLVIGSLYWVLILTIEYATARIVDAIESLKPKPKPDAETSTSLRGPS